MEKLGIEIWRMMGREFAVVCDAAWVREAKVWRCARKQHARKERRGRRVV